MWGDGFVGYQGFGYRFSFGVGGREDGIVKLMCFFGEMVRIMGFCFWCDDGGC